MAEIPHTGLDLARRNTLTIPKARTHLAPPKTLAIPEIMNYPTNLTATATKKEYHRKDCQQNRHYHRRQKGHQQ